jgi:serine/alanine adding enzyme
MDSRIACVPEIDSDMIDTTTPGYQGAAVLSASHPATTVTAELAGDTPEERAAVARRVGNDLWFRPEWDRAYRVYGLETLRLIARRNHEVVGVLPLVAMRSRLFGCRLVSLPWFDSVGCVADEDEARQCLLNEARALAAARGIGRIDLRQNTPVDGWQVERDDKVLMKLSLESDPEKLWKRFDSKVRNQVRKGEKSDLKATTGGSELLNAFFDVYSTNMRDLGSPPHSRRFFAAVLSAFPEEAKVHVVRVGATVVGAGLTIANNSRLEIPWASSLQKYNRFCVNHVLYWHILKQACLDGYASFNFGRSTKDSGPYRFKQQWGAEELSLFWYSLNQNAQCQVDSRPPQADFSLAIRFWQRLPLWLARSLGPWIIRQVP